ncbi:MAG: hypothetical protein QOI57_120 [Rubrobacteraceae bacterium]|jgi:hypothetical protein|nr:hypothetical protein [Rubrobacteraceae bacterium]
MTDDDLLRGIEGRGEGFEWEDEPDLTSVSEELKARLEELAEEERAISYRRRVIQGRIDLISAELVRGGGVALSPEELARVLLGGGERFEAQDGESQGSPSGRGGDF